jgi:hypothetical protein
MLGRVGRLRFRVVRVVDSAAARHQVGLSSVGEQTRMDVFDAHDAAD